MMPDFWDSIPDATPNGKQSIPNATGSDFWDSIPAAEEEPDYSLQGLGVSKEELGPKPTGEEMLRGVKGAAKGAASLATGAVSWIPAGLTGAAVIPMKAIEGAVTGDVAGKLQEAAKTVQDVQDFWSYIPDDPEAQRVVNVGAAPFEGLAKLGRMAGEAIVDKTGSPALATIAGTAIEGLPFLAGAGAVGARRGIRGIREGVDSLKGMEGVTEPMPLEAGRPVLSEKAKSAIAYEAPPKEAPPAPLAAEPVKAGEAKSGGSLKEPWQMTREEAASQGKSIATPSLNEPNPNTAEIAFAGKQDGFVYRGTETEGELNNIIATGQIESSGETAKRLQKSKHDGMTFYSDRPHVASSYIKRDGYLLELAGDMVPGLKSVGAGELSSTRPTPASAIRRVLRVGRDHDGVYAFDVTDQVVTKLREVGHNMKAEPEEVILSFLGTGETGKMGHIAAPVAIGAAAGIESDEEGKLTYNPTKGLIGAVGLTAAPLAMKPVKAVGRAIGKTGPGRAWREFWKPLSTIPESEQYLIERYKSFGDVDRAERLADRTHQRLKKLPDDQKKSVFQFLDGQIDEAALPESVVPLAKTLQTVNTMIGRMLVKRGLLDEKAFAANKGQYIRYLYLRHVLGDKLTGLGQGGAKMDLSYLKKRKDLTPEERRAIGWIEDVSIAEPVSIARPLSDIAKYDFMSKVASNENWTWKPSIVEVEGQKMTVGKLAEELANQESVAKKLPDVPEVTARLATLRDAMNRAQGATKNVPADFVQLNGRNYGPLDGAFVKKPIARDLKPVVDIPTDFHSNMLNSIINVERKGMAAFKVGKVAFNLPTVVRNIGSNIIQLNMSGIPLAEIPVHYSKALYSMLKKDGTYREAVRRGIFKTNWSATEINEILKEVRQWEGKSWYSIAPRLRNIAKYYGKIDDLAKMTKFREQIGKGVSPDKAAIEAQKWGMDYSLAHPVVKTARRHVAPFLTYQTKILPLIAETLADRPWIIAKYAMIPSILTAVVRDKFNYSDDQWAKLQKLLPRFIQNSESYMPLPAKTPEGNLEWVDAQYFLPWGSAMEALDSAVEGRPREAVQGIGIGNPFFQIAKVLTETSRNDPPTDPFTKKEIYSRLDTPKEQVLKTLEWVYNQWAPSMMTRWGAAGYTATVGKKDKYGRTITPEQAAGRWFGVNIAAPSRKQAEISKRVDAKELRSSIFRKLLDPTISKEKKAEYRREYFRQMKELQQGGS